MIMERLLTPATVDLLTLSTVKAHVREEESFTGNDAVLSALMAAGVEQVRQIVSKSLLQETWEANFAAPDALGQLVLTRSPFVSVTSVQVLRSGTYETLTVDTDYVVRRLSDERVAIRPPRGSNGAQGSFGQANDDEAAFRVVYVAGYGAAASDVPAPIACAALLYIADLYQTREASRQANIVDNPAAMRLLSPFRATIV